MSWHQFLPRLFLFSCILLIAGAIARAADDKNYAAVSISQVDGDFPFQGEFAGGGIGLQVVALGGGKFQAVEYSGGLPGNGWDKQSRRKYQGAKTDSGTVELSAAGRKLAVHQSYAALHDASGRQLARLEKYHRLSRSLGAAPASGGRVLFNGTETGQFVNGLMTDDRLLMIGADTKQPVRDFTLHVEFRTPYMPQARGQGRGNSGVYIQGRYEVQILDSFGLDGVNNECGSLYQTKAPDVNMCLPPLAWQTYDIDFTAARFDASGKKSANARITVRHNGVVVQNDYEIPNKTGAGAAEGPDSRQIKFQNHGNPVHFRNIWIVEREGAKSSAVEGLSSACDQCRNVVNSSPWREPKPFEITSSR